MNLPNGLPLHPLLVHLIVVLLPLTALAAILHAVWPTAARRLGIVTPLAGLGVLIMVPITQKAGAALAADLGGGSAAIGRHSGYGQALLPWSIALFVVTLALWLWHGPVLQGVRSRSGRGLQLAVRVILIVAALGVGVGATIWTVLTGDSGAQAVWGQGA